MTTQEKIINDDILKQIDTLEVDDLYEGIRGLRARHFEEPARFAVEKPQIAMKAWQETEDRPVQERWAHLFKRVLEETPVTIFEGELTAGNETRWFRGFYPRVEMEAPTTLNYLKEDEQEGGASLLSPAHKAVQLTDEERQVLKESANFFLGKTGSDLVREVIRETQGSWYYDLVKTSGAIPTFFGGLIDSGIPNFEKVLKKGLKGIMAEAEAGIRKFDNLEEDDPEKLIFWKAVLTTNQAVIALANRYANEAIRMATETQDPTRKAQLERMAEACGWVPENPARNFFEAVQSMRLIYLATKLEGVYACSAGLVDQLLYPYFMADLKAGQLTVKEALNIMADYFLYLGRQQDTLAKKSAEVHQSEASLVNVTLGGVYRNGEDANTEMTWLILHLYGLLKVAQPQPTFRLNPITPKQFMMKAMETNVKVGGGQPQFHNDAHIIRFLESKGVPIEDAREWAVFGCSQPFPVQRYGANMKEAFWSNITLFMDLALHNGVASMTGKRVGLETGDPRTFKTFDELFDAVKTQIEFIERRLCRLCRLAMKTWGQRQRVPFFSSVLPGCVENGKDAMVGGQLDHPNWYAKDRGIVNAADSLTAIKKLVFEEKKLTMDELLNTLDSNFEGEQGEEIRQMCLNAPKYGNEIPEADAMVREIGKFSAGVIHSEHNPFSSQPYAINRNGLGFHFFAGKGVGATPDGRKAGTPLANGSLSPMQGMDRSGPTAALNSNIAADFTEVATSITNMRFPKGTVVSPESMEKLAALTQAFENSGGTHIQYNLLDHQELVAAKKNPDKYKDLVVRVAGYSTYFIALSPEIQDEIIHRTQHGL